MEAATFLRIAIPLPREIASRPIVIFRGYELAVETLAVVAILGSVAIPLATAFPVGLDWWDRREFHTRSWPLPHCRA